FAGYSLRSLHLRLSLLLNSPRGDCGNRNQQDEDGCQASSCAPCCELRRGQGRRLGCLARGLRRLSVANQALPLLQLPLTLILTRGLPLLARLDEREVGGRWRGRIWGPAGDPTLGVQNVLPG